MSGFTDRVSQGILNHIVGKTTIFTLPTSYVALFTANGIDAGTGFTECSGGNYARVATAAADWNSATGSAPSTITNANALTFPTATAGWGNVIAFGLYDAASAGNLLAWDFFGAYQWLPATVIASSPGSIACHAHGYSTADLIEWTIEYGGVTPTFSQSNFTGVLSVTSPTTDGFSVQNGGIAVNTSSSGNGMVRKLISQTISSGVQPSFPPSS